MSEAPQTLDDLKRERLDLLINLRDAVLRYGKTIGSKRALGVSWSSGLEENEIADLLHRALDNIEASLAKAVAIYPDEMMHRVIKAENEQDRLNDKLDRIADILDEDEEDEEG